MVINGRCKFVMPDGRLCRSSPLRDEEFCLFHCPSHNEKPQETRRLGDSGAGKKRHSPAHMSLRA